MPASEIVLAHGAVLSVSIRRQHVRSGHKNTSDAVRKCLLVCSGEILLTGPS